MGGPDKGWSTARWADVVATATVPSVVVGDTSLSVATDGTTPCVQLQVGQADHGQPSDGPAAPHSPLPETVAAAEVDSIFPPVVERVFDNRVAQTAAVFG